MRISCLYSYIPSLLSLPPPPPPKLSPSWNVILFIPLVRKTWCQHALLECSHLFWGKFSSSPGVPERHSSWSPPHGVLVNGDSLVCLLTTSFFSPPFFVGAVLLRSGGKGLVIVAYFSFPCSFVMPASTVVEPSNPRFPSCLKSIEIYQRNGLINNSDQRAFSSAETEKTILIGKLVGSLGWGFRDQPDLTHQSFSFWLHSGWPLDPSPGSKNRKTGDQFRPR